MQFSLTSPGAVLNATHYFSEFSLLLVNASSYDNTNSDSADRIQVILNDDPNCVIGAYSFTGARPLPDAALLKAMRDGVAGLGIQGQTVTATPGRYSFGVCDASWLPPKSSIRKFKASPSAKAACGKIKGVLGNIAQGSAPAKMQGRVNPMASTPGMDTMDTLKPAAAKAKKSSPFAPLNCSVSWATAFNLSDKVGGLGGFKVTNHACVWGAAGATAPIPA